MKTKQQIKEELKSHVNTIISHKRLYTGIARNGMWQWKKESYRYQARILYLAYAFLRGKPKRTVEANYRQRTGIVEDITKALEPTNSWDAYLTLIQQKDGLYKNVKDWFNAPLPSNT